MSQTPKLSLPYIAPQQAQKHVTVNESLSLLDTIAQLSVNSRSIDEEPTAPTNGDSFILTSQATGPNWSLGGVNDIINFNDGVWRVLPPQIGWRAYIKDEDLLMIWRGDAWHALTANSSPVNPAMLGINASASTTNRLAVKSNAVLFSHDDAPTGDGDMRLFINRAASADTASLLFQTDHIGAAEIGLTGADRLSIKVTSDNILWTEPLSIETDGRITIQTAMSVTPLWARDNSDLLQIKGKNTPGSAAGMHIVSPSNGIGRIVFSDADSDFRGGVYYNHSTETLQLYTNGALTHNFAPGRCEVFSTGIPYFILANKNTSGGTNRIQFNQDSENKRCELSANWDLQSYGAVRISAPTNTENNHTTIIEFGANGIIASRGLIVGAAAGGYKGGGTINAQAIYDDNALLSCYVFDQAVSGAINEAKWHAMTPTNYRPIDAHFEDEQTLTSDDNHSVSPSNPGKGPHEPMVKFKHRIGGRYDPLTLDGYARHWREKKHLTSLPNEKKFDIDKGMPAGAWIQRLVETVEIQAVLIETLNQRLKKIEHTQTHTAPRTSRNGLP